MKTIKRLFILAVVVCLIGLFFLSCTDGEGTGDENNNPLPPGTVAYETDEEGVWIRTLQNVSFDGLSFTEWDVEEAVAQAGEQKKKPYTIMLYLNGSDLESEAGMATGDLVEMIESGFDSNSINVVILTGGTQEWQNEIISGDTCSLYKIADNNLQFIADIGQLNIGDASTLAGFIDFGMQAFPADRYGLILWNHGGGSIAGFGVDENHDYDGLNLLELNLALERSLVSQTPLEFIGFDACLMATVETAAVVQDYAKYLIASEELEPGYGWNYHCLAELGKNPHMDGAAFGKIIVDMYADFYAGSGDDVTLAVIDLDKANEVLHAMGQLMLVCNNDFSQETYRQLAKSRNNTKYFGGGSPRDNECDMVDVADMAAKLESLYPAEAREVIQAVKNAVIYQKKAGGVDGAHGLSTYYVFGGKEQALESVEMYKALGMNPYYTNFLINFASELTGETIAKIDIADQVPVEDSEGNYSIKLSPEELDNLLEIYFTVWEPVPDEPDYYFLLGETSDVEISPDGTIKTEFEGEWPGINGDFVCLYEIGTVQGGKKYAIPAVLNGEDVDIIAVFDANNPEGRIIGARPLTDEGTPMAAKNLLKIKKGDKLKFLYYAEYFGEEEDKQMEEWYEGEEFTVQDELEIEMLGVNPGEVYMYGFLLKDLQLNEYYTDFIEVEFIE